MKTVDIKGKSYVMVNERVGEFHRLYPKGSIQTEILSDLSSATIVIKATVTPGDGRTFTGHASERIGDGMINKTSALENAETSAVGRALGMLNIGILESLASADEVVKAVQGAKEPALNRPTPIQKQQIAKLCFQAGIPLTADDQTEFNEFCLGKIGSHTPENVEQANLVIAALEEKILDQEQARATSGSH